MVIELVASTLLNGCCLPLIAGHEFGQVIGDGLVQLVDGAALEEGAGGGQRGELVQRVDPEELL